MLEDSLVNASLQLAEEEWYMVTGTGGRRTTHKHTDSPTDCQSDSLGAGVKPGAKAGT